MVACDHSAMTTAGPDARSVCAGCGVAMGKFSAPDGAVFTTESAFLAYTGALS